jgi:hypothetical protein
MKAGCIGFVIIALVVAIALVGGGAVLFSAGSIFEIPSRPPAQYSASDGYRAQQKLFSLLPREGRRPPREVVLTEPEINAFLARHLAESEGIPLSPIVVKLRPGIVEIQGMTTFRTLLRGFPFRLLPEYLPGTTFDRPVWVSVRGVVEMPRGQLRSERQYGRLRIIEFGLGGQDLGAWVLWLMLGPEVNRHLFQWPVPPVVETIAVDQGRVVIGTAR